MAQRGRPRKIRDPEADVEADREPRVTQTRARSAREVAADYQRSALYVPRERWPQGMTLRWVAFEVEGAVNNMNWSKRIRDGWVPCRRSDYGDLFPSLPIPGHASNGDDSIIFGGLCLCQRPSRDVARDRKFIEAETEAQMSSFKDYVEERGHGTARVLENRTDHTLAKVKSAEFKEDSVAEA